MDSPFTIPPADMKYFTPINQNFFSPDTVKGSSYSNTMFGSTSGSSNGLQHSATVRVRRASNGRSAKPETPKQDCRFRMMVVDECYKSRLYASALEYYLLGRAASASDPVGCLMTRCEESFGNAKEMLCHLKACPYFAEGEYQCPECNRTEKFRTTSKKQCSWRRPRISDKAMKFLQASAEVIKRLTSTKSKLCPNCQHIVQEDFDQELANHGTPVHEHTGALPHNASELGTNSHDYGAENLGKKPSSSSTVPSWLNTSELMDTSARAELPWEPSHEQTPEQLNEQRSELWGEWGDHTFNHLMGYKSTGVQGVVSLPQEPNSNSNSPPTEISCASANSDGSYSPNVSPPSTVRSPSAGGNTIHVHHPNISSFLPMGSQRSTASIERQPTSYFSSSWYKQPTHTTPDVCFPDISEVDVLSQHSFGINNATNIPRANFRSGRQTPPLSRLEIPHTWGPGTSDISWEQIMHFGNSDTTIAAATAAAITTTSTPTVQSFRNSMAKTTTNVSPKGAPPMFTAQSNTSTRRQEKSSIGFSSSENASPESAFSSSSSSSTGEMGLTPDSSSKQTPSPSSDFRCECGFTPKGKVEKFPTYLYKHRQTHDKDVRFSCPQCGKTYSRKDNVTQHVKKAHVGLGALLTRGGRKRLGSVNSDQIQAQRKKSRSYDDEESVALSVPSEWGTI